MKRNEQKQGKKNVVSAVAAAAILSLGSAPAWAQNDQISQQKGSQSRQSSGASDMLISASALQDARVIDQQNREIGKITNLFVDPQNGRITRADIDFNSGMFGSGRKYSVAWDQLSVKRQNGDMVVALDQSIVQRVQQAQTNDTGRRDDVYGQQERERQDAQSARTGGVVGRVGSDQREQQQVSASQLSSEHIREIQQKLNKEGFHAGQVNGEWSSETQNALRNFQESKGLQATGQLDERTIDELDMDADELRKEGRSESGSKGDSGSGNNR
jgi:sporulation protein YlmC with PRC-barrel domain